MMRKQLAAVLAAGIAFAGAIVPAKAVNLSQSIGVMFGTGMSAQQAVLHAKKAITTPPVQNAQSIAFQSVERTVRDHNPTIKGLQKTLGGLEATDVDMKFWDQEQSYQEQNKALKKQAESYEASAKQLRDAAADAEPGSATEKALRAQAAQMDRLAQQARMTIKVNEGILAGLDDAKDDAEDELKETIASTKRQLTNAADQIVVGAQTQYIALCTMQDNLAEIDRSIAALDRTLPVMEKQYALGMVSEQDVLALKSQRQTAVSGKQTLENQMKTMQNSLSLALGNTADTTVSVQELPEVTSRDLMQMNYAKDLEKARENSYAIWQKKDALRKASNDYEDNITSTKHAYEAAKIDLQAAEQAMENSFRALYDGVLEKQRLLEKAQADAALAESKFRTASVKYERGMISKLEFEKEKDTLESERSQVKTAKTELLTAYQSYQWAIRGVM